MRGYKVLKYASSVKPTGKCVVCEAELPRGRIKYCTNKCSWKFYDENTLSWNRIREKIIKRDKNKCQKCGAYSKSGSGLHVHHIKFVKDFPELEFEHDNCITMCEDCHKLQHQKFDYELTIGVKK